MVRGETTQLCLGGRVRDSHGRDTKARSLSSEDDSFGSGLVFRYWLTATSGTRRVVTVALLSAASRQLDEVSVNKILKRFAGERREATVFINATPKERVTVIDLPRRLWRNSGWRPNEESGRHLYTRFPPVSRSLGGGDASRATPSCFVSSAIR